MVVGAEDEGYQRAGRQCERPEHSSGELHNYLVFGGGLSLLYFRVGNLQRLLGGWFAYRDHQVGCCADIDASLKRTVLFILYDTQTAVVAMLQSAPCMSAHHKSMYNDIHDMGTRCCEQYSTLYYIITPCDA